MICTDSAASLLIYPAAAFAGVIAGIFTGVLPGLHVNAAAVIAASFLNRHEIPGGNAAVAAFILAMSISHVFHEFLPSVFLGFSGSEAAMAVLPGHRMLLRGEGRKAVLVAAAGALLGVAGTALLFPMLIAALKAAFTATKAYVAPILAAAIALNFLKGGKRRAAINAVVLSLSGALGLAVFGLPNMREPLLPMLSGLFGVSSLAGSLMKKSSFPVQCENAAIRTRKPLKAAGLVAAGIFSSSLMALFPALGPAQAAMIGTAALRRLKAESYMFLLGVISSASMLLGLLTLYSFGKARNGSIAVIGNILPVNSDVLLLLLAAATASALVSFITANAISKGFASVMARINYPTVCKAVIASIAAIVLLLSGLTGLLVLAASTAIGLIPLLARSSRQLLMGCLMVPVIGYYL